MKFIVSLLIAVFLLVGISNAKSCSSNRNAFYCALNSPPCFWKAEGHGKFACITIKSQPALEGIENAVQSSEEYQGNSVCTYLSESVCKESQQYGCQWENESCIKFEGEQENYKKFCETFKGKLSCVLSNCQWSDNHCHY
ncbi:hypothetical protein ACTA71_011448 [Dictyostelium dimigraforme]